MSYTCTNTRQPVGHNKGEADAKAAESVNVTGSIISCFSIDDEYQTACFNYPHRLSPPNDCQVLDLPIDLRAFVYNNFAT